MKTDFLVLGAGPAGIAAGMALGGRGRVLEQSASAGGLSSSLYLDGAVFDLGGHSFHTPHPGVRRLAESAIDLFEQTRDARCFTHGQLIPYPFQKHFRRIADASVASECSSGLSQAGGETRASHFLEYLEQRFGAGIAKHFLVPYNQKLWGSDLKRLAADWVGERVAAPEGERESFEETGGRRKPLQPNTRVAYPARGGFGDLMAQLACRLPDARYDSRVVAIDTRDKLVTTQCGARHSYQRLISTLPLPTLVGLCGGAPESVTRALAALEHLSLKVVLLVLDHPVSTEVQRVYCADDTVPAHKVAFNHNSSDYLRALPHNGVMAEISCAKPLPSNEELAQWTIRGLEKMQLLSRDRLVRSQVIDVSHAYPVPTHGRDAAVAEIRSWLRERDIETLGRFGEWAYINSDEAMHRGLALGKRLLEEVPPSR